MKTVMFLTWRGSLSCLPGPRTRRGKPFLGHQLHPYRHLLLYPWSIPGPLPRQCLPRNCQHRFGQSQHLYSLDFTGGQGGGHPPSGGWNHQHPPGAEIHPPLEWTQHPPLFLSSGKTFKMAIFRIIPIAWFWTLITPYMKVFENIENCKITYYTYHP